MKSSNEYRIGRFAGVYDEDLVRTAKTISATNADWEAVHREIETRNLVEILKAADSDGYLRCKNCKVKLSIDYFEQKGRQCAPCSKSELMAYKRRYEALKEPGPRKTSEIKIESRAERHFQLRVFAATLLVLFGLILPVVLLLFLAPFAIEFLASSQTGVKTRSMAAIVGAILFIGGPVIGAIVLTYWLACELSARHMPHGIDLHRAMLIQEETIQLSIVCGVMLAIFAAPIAKFAGLW